MRKRIIRLLLRITPKRSAIPIRSHVPKKNNKKYPIMRSHSKLNEINKKSLFVMLRIFHRFFSKFKTLKEILYFDFPHRRRQCY